MPQSQHVYSQIIWIIQTSWVFKIELEVLHRQTLPTVCTVMRKKYSQRNFPWLNEPGNNSIFFPSTWSDLVIQVELWWKCSWNSSLEQPRGSQWPFLTGEEKILTVRTNYWRGHPLWQQDLQAPTLRCRGAAVEELSPSLPLHGVNWGTTGLIPELSGWSLNNLLHPAWSRITHDSQHTWTGLPLRFQEYEDDCNQ